MKKISEQYHNTLCSGLLIMKSKDVVNWKMIGHANQNNPDNRYWSLTQRPGFLRLTTGRVDNNFDK